MHIVLYALAAVVLVGSVIASRVALGRAEQGLDLELEMNAAVRLDLLLSPTTSSAAAPAGPSVPVLARVPAERPAFPAAA